MHTASKDAGGSSTSSAHPTITSAPNSERAHSATDSTGSIPTGANPALAASSQEEARRAADVEKIVSAWTVDRDEREPLARLVAPHILRGLIVDAAVVAKYSLVY